MRLFCHLTRPGNVDSDEEEEERPSRSLRQGATAPGSPLPGRQPIMIATDVAARGLDFPSTVSDSGLLNLE